MVAKINFIGQVARQAGVGVQTVRYYERLGLLPPAQRTSTGYRVYSSEVVGQLRFIKNTQTLGLSLQEIKEILRLKYSGQSPCRCVRERLETRLREIQKEMVRLTGMQRELSACLRRTRNLPRLPHAASLIGPIIETQRTRKSSKKLDSIAH